MPSQDEELKKQIESQFSKMESEAEAAAPGVLEMLRVCGNYEAALQQVDRYFELLNPQPNFTTTSSSGGPKDV